MKIFKVLKRILSQWWIRLIIGLLLLYLLFSRVDFRVVIREISHIPITIILIIVLIFFITQFIVSIRFFYLLKLQSIPIRIIDVFKLNLFGFFSAYFLPGIIGADLARGTILSKYTSKKDSLWLTIITDRVVGFASLLIVLSLFIPHLFSLFNISFIRSSYFWILISILLSALIIIFLVWKLLKPGKLYYWLRERVKNARYTISLWIKQPLVFVVSVLISISGLLIGYIATYITARALDIHLNYFDIISIGLVLQLIVILPISFNGVGISELGLVFFYTQLGISLETSTAFALFGRTMSILLSLSGLWYLMFPNLQKMNEPS